MNERGVILQALDLYNVLLQLVIHFAELLVMENLIHDLTELVTFLVLSALLLVVVLTEEEHDILSKLLFNPEIRGVSRADQDRTVHHEFERLSGASLLAW